MPELQGHVHDDIDAWALGALDAAELRIVERHIADCAECAALADRARDDAAAIAMTVPLRSASSTLRARVMAGAVVLDDVPGARATSARLWPLAAAASFALFAGVTAWAVVTNQELGDARDERSALAAGSTEQAERLAVAGTTLAQVSLVGADARAANDAMAEIVASGDAAGLAMAGTGAASAAGGTYVWSRSAGRGALVARGLPPLAEGKSYCLWLVYERDWVVGGQFTLDADGDGRIVVQDLDVDPESAGRLEGFAVTIEPEGPVTKHTGETVLEATIQR